MKWLDDLPILPFALISIMLALAPFQPEPHLWQKVKMLMAGELGKPIDIFDLFLHGIPISLFVIKLVRKIKIGVNI